MANKNVATVKPVEKSLILDLGDTGKFFPEWVFTRKGDLAGIYSSAKNVPEELVKELAHQVIEVQDIDPVEARFFVELHL